VSAPSTPSRLAADPIASPLAPDRRIRVGAFAAFIAAGLAVVGVLVGGIAPPAGAQVTTTTSRLVTTTSEPFGPETTEAAPSTVPRGALTTATRSPTTPRPTTPQTQAQTTRRTPASTGAPTTRVATTVATTVPTMPASTQVPALLVPGPNNTMPGAQEPAGEGVSTNAALRWVVAGLVAVAAALGGLTLAYWRHTKPDPAGGGTGGGSDWDPGPDADLAPGYTKVNGAGWAGPAADPGYRAQPTFTTQPAEPEDSSWGPH
jgi:hypothetical protein